jgi:hypothetical protein
MTLNPDLLSYVFPQEIAELNVNLVAVGVSCADRGFLLATDSIGRWRF